MATLRVADYADTPGGRYRRDGMFSGEWFREDVLKPKIEGALRTNERLTVYLDDVFGYGSSFLEEAFGGLIRKGHFNHDELERVLKIEAGDELYQYYADLVRKYIQNARRECIAA